MLQRKLTSAAPASNSCLIDDVSPEKAAQCSRLSPSLHTLYHRELFAHAHRVKQQSNADCTLTTPVMHLSETHHQACVVVCNTFACNLIADKQPVRKPLSSIIHTYTDSKESWPVYWLEICVNLLCRSKKNQLVLPPVQGRFGLNNSCGSSDCRIHAAHLCRSDKSHGRYRPGCSGIQKRRLKTEATLQIVS